MIAAKIDPMDTDNEAHTSGLPLLTDRLRIRPVQPSDVPAFIDIYQERDAMHYIPGGVRDTAGVQQRVAELIAHHDDRPDSGDRQRLWNLSARIPPEQRFSRIYRGRGELIDHILVSHALVDRIAAGEVTTDAAGDTASIDDDPQPSPRR